MSGAFFSRFTPSMMPHAALEAIFVQRQPLLERTVDLVRDSAITEARHHSLLIGPRGIGKTHLVSLVYHRIRAMADLRDRLCIAWLREEEWGVSTFLDLLLRVLRALAAEDASLAGRIEVLYERSPAEAMEAASRLLLEYIGERTLLLLIENLDEMFDGLGDEGQKRLRSFLQEHPSVAIVATAQALFGGISLQTSPFYGFFRITHLKALTQEEAVALIGRIAAHKGDHKLADFVRTPDGRARVRAVRHLAGGNHRIYVVLSQFLTREALDELVQPFLQALDDLTPYYQSRLKLLSPQQQKIIELLCDRRSALMVKDIAQRCFMSPQTAASQLRALRERGYVSATPIGRESYYELQEPLLRLCIEVKKNRGEPVPLFIDFLRLWYSHAEMERRLAGLPLDQALERAYLAQAIRMVEAEAEPPIEAKIKEYEEASASGNHGRALRAAVRLTKLRGSTNDWARRGQSEIMLKRADAALRSFDRAVELEPDDPQLWRKRAEALMALQRLEDALASLTTVTLLDPSNKDSWNTHHLLNAQLNRYEDCLADLDHVLALDSNDVTAWCYRSLALNSLGRHTEALEAGDRAIRLRPSWWVVWSVHATTLIGLRRFEEALAVTEKALDLGEYALVWDQHACILLRLFRYDEALKACDKGLATMGPLPDLLCSRAVALCGMGQWEESLLQMEQALRTRLLPNLLRETMVALVVVLFDGAADPQRCRRHGRALLALCTHFEEKLCLGMGLVSVIARFKSTLVSDAALREWLNLWRDLAAPHREFAAPLRLMEAAVRYRETGNERVWMDLPVEERALLEQVWKQGPQDS